jgi:hypothetical protein
VVAGVLNLRSLGRYLTAQSGQRLQDGEVDMSLKSAYGIMGVSPKTPQEDACDYYQIDLVGAR